MASKSDAIVKLVLVFVISLLSFAVGTFVGKKYSDQQHKISAYEPTNNDSHREVAAEKNSGHTAGQMTDDEIAKLAEEFVTDDSSEVVAKDDKHEEAATEPKAAAEHKEAAKPLEVAKTKEAPKVDTVKAAVREEPRLPAAITKDVSQYPTGKFTVQVASFSSETDAKKRADELKHKGFSAFYLTANVHGKTWYRVSVGQFPTEQEAKNYRSEFMHKTKIESAIIQKVAH